MTMVSAIGLIVPSTNRTNEHEFARTLPSSVSLHAARIRGGPISTDLLSAMGEEAERAGGYLADARVDVIAFGCTTASLLEGVAYADRLEQRIAHTTSTPTVVTSKAVIAALNALGVENVGVATPYPDSIADRVKHYIEASGFNVVAENSLGLKKPEEVATRQPAQVLDHASSVAVDDAEGIFISCTDYPTFDIIRDLETEVGRPVVTSNQATLWRSFSHLAEDPQIDSLGSLFTK